MEKTCPIKFDVECDKVIECQVPNQVIRCKHLKIEVDSDKVFMGHPMKNCTVICTRTKRPFEGEELTLVIKCTEEDHDNLTCPRAEEPDAD